MIDLTKYTDRYKSTEDYKPDDTDIIYEYDNYICIIQVASKINNVVFLEKEPIHKQTLLKDVEHIITYINHNYRLQGTCRPLRLVLSRLAPVLSYRFHFG